MADLIAMFDMGHGGNDPGGVDNDSRTKEADVVKKIADQAILKLKEYQGIDVRVGPRPIAVTNVGRLNPRSDFANSIPVDFVVSFHTGTSSDRNIRGVQAFVYDNAPDKSMELAHAIMETTTEWFREKGIPIRDIDLSNDSILRRVKMPAVMIYFGYVSNKEDVRVIKDDKNLRELGDLVAQAIVSFYKLKPVPTSKDEEPSKDDNSEEEIQDVSIEINGETLNGKKINGTTYVPLRSFVGITKDDLDSTGRVVNGTSLETIEKVGNINYVTSSEIATVVNMKAQYIPSSNTVRFTKK